MSPSARLLTLSLLVVLSACGREGGRDAVVAGEPPGTSLAPPPGEASERTWAGLLPCSDCQGIDTRLVLRTERGRRDYVLTETYLGGSGKTSFNRAGSWGDSRRQAGAEPRPPSGRDPGQATQRFALQPDGALELLDAEGKEPEDPLAYRLQRL